MIRYRGIQGFSPRRRVQGFTPDRIRGYTAFRDEERGVGDWSQLVTGILDTGAKLYTAHEDRRFSLKMERLGAQYQYMPPQFGTQPYVPNPIGPAPAPVQPSGGLKLDGSMGIAIAVGVGAIALLALRR